MHSSAAQSTVQTPLCVDLDGTLVRTDTLAESFLRLCHEHPLQACRALWSLRHGVAPCKRSIAQSTGPSSPPPFNDVLLSYLRTQAARGRPLILATASDMIAARSIVEPLGIFDDVIGSDGCTNLKGSAKASLLQKRFGRGGFDYAGDSMCDLPVWAVCNNAIVVSDSARFIRRVSDVARIAAVFPGGRRRRLLAAIRPHQWTKNLLVFAPLLFSHRLAELDLWIASCVSFALFSLCASGIYIFNDLLDLAEDRRSPERSNRPLATGDVSVATGILTSLLLMGSGVMLSWLYAGELGILLAAYCGAGMMYSLWLKRLPAIDVLMLAGFSITRIFAGSIATGIEPSKWLVLFFLFSLGMLALLKRYTDLARRYECGQSAPARGGYSVPDLPILAQLGIASGFASSIVLALYISADTTRALYPRANMLWLLFPLFLAWIGRMWTLAARGRGHSDTTKFIAHDRTSMLLLVLSLLILLLASLP